MTCIRCKNVGMSIVAAMSLMLTGCFDNGNGTASSSHVFVANTDSSTISIFGTDESTAELTPIDEINASGDNPTDLIMHPNGAYLIVMNSDASSLTGWGENGSVSVYNYDASTGGLTENNTVALAEGGGMALNGALTPDGEYLYVTDQYDFEIHSFAVNGDNGALTELDFSPTAEYEAHAIVMHPSGSFFYAGTETSQIHGHQINPATGAYTGTPNTPYSTSTSGNNWLSITPNGDYLYTVDPRGNTIEGFEINGTTGELTALAGFPITHTGNSAKCSAISPSGEYFYIGASVSGGGSVYVYSVEDNGSLSYVNEYSAGTHPKSISLNSDGSTLYVANYEDDNVSAFTVDTATGGLTEVDKYAVGEGPKRVLVGP